MHGIFFYDEFSVQIIFLQISGREFLGVSAGLGVKIGFLRILNLEKNTTFVKNSQLILQ